MKKSQQRWMKKILESVEESNEYIKEFGGGGEIGHTKDLWKFTAPQKAVKEAWEKSEKVELDEKAPPSFPKKLYNKIKKQYSGNPEAAYATMWKVHNQIKEIVGNKCECEQIGCKHGESSCQNAAKEDVKTIFGLYKMCKDCADALPDEYRAEVSDTEYQNSFGDVEPENDYFLKDNTKKLKETSGTGAAPGYLTPNAFTGGNPKGERKRNQSATTGTGYTIVGDKE